MPGCEPSTFRPALAEANPFHRRFAMIGRNSKAGQEHVLSFLLFLDLSLTLDFEDLASGLMPSVANALKVVLA